jgi:hypothetical protein
MLRNVYIVGRVKLWAVKHSRVYVYSSYDVPCLGTRKSLLPHVYDKLNRFLSKYD